MKKLLILMLVLGLASAANATLTYEIVTWDTDVANLKLIGTGDSLGIYEQEIYITAGGTFVPDSTCTYKPGVNNEAGDLGTVFADIYDGYNCYAKDSDDTIMPNQSLGDWFVFDVMPDAGATEITIEIWGIQNEWAGPLATGTLPIPEPMTIALLGLGSLFLLRRRK